MAEVQSFVNLQISPEELKEKAKTVNERIEALKLCDGWLFFDTDTDDVFADTLKSTPTERKKLGQSFASFDNFIAEGFTVAGERYDAHRVFIDTGLAYGRKGDSKQGVGIVSIKVKNALLVATFKFPHVSARIVTSLLAILKEMASRYIRWPHFEWIWHSFLSMMNFPKFV